MAKSATASLLILSSALMVSTPALAGQAKADQERQEIRKMARGTLARLYKAQPSAKAGEKGAALQGALAVSPGVWLYQLTDTGLALELTAKGTKYYKDEALN